MNEKDLNPLQLLHTVFGYEQFRGHQAGVIDHLIGGGDALVLMPTGGGKSLCYQIPLARRSSFPPPPLRSAGRRR